MNALVGLRFVAHDACTPLTSEAGYYVMTDKD